MYIAPISQIKTFHRNSEDVNQIPRKPVIHKIHRFHFVTHSHPSSQWSRHLSTSARHVASQNYPQSGRLIVTYVQLPGHVITSINNDGYDSDNTTLTIWPFTSTCQPITRKLHVMSLVANSVISFHYSQLSGKNQHFSFSSLFKKMFLSEKHVLHVP